MQKPGHIVGDVMLRKLFFFTLTDHIKFFFFNITGPQTCMLGGHLERQL